MITPTTLRHILDIITAWEHSEDILVRMLWKTEDGSWWATIRKTENRKSYDMTVIIDDRSRLQRLLDDLRDISRQNRIFPSHIAKPPPPANFELLIWYEEENGAKHHAWIALQNNPSEEKAQT